MATCPYCNENGISSFKANMKNPGKLLECTLCKKESAVPMWPKFFGIFIILVYMFMKNVVPEEVALTGLIVVLPIYLVITAVFLEMDKKEAK